MTSLWHSRQKTVILTRTFPIGCGVPTNLLPSQNGHSIFFSSTSTEFIVCDLLYQSSHDIISDEISFNLVMLD